MTASERNGPGGGNGAGRDPDKPNKGDDPFDDFDALIRDREDPFDVDFEMPRRERSRPRGGYDPYADFEPTHADALSRIIDLVSGIAGGALSPEARRQLEKTLRDLLVLLRNLLNRIIESLDARSEDDFEIEEIPID